MEHRPFWAAKGVLFRHLFPNCFGWMTVKKSCPVTVERVPLGSYPTPVEPIDDRLWVKRDDLTSAVYGGNKVRKLELFFAAARAEGKSRLLTLGAAGSHQVLATALFGAQNGFEVEAVLVPQPASEHGKENLRTALAYEIGRASCRERV